MTVKIKRNTDFVGTMAKFKVIVNGEKVGTIGHEEFLEVEIPDDEAVIQLSQMGVRTNEMNVKDGDRLEVSTSNWGKYGVFAVIFLFLISRLFAPNVIRYGLFLLYFISAFVVNGFMYKIIKVPSQPIFENEE